MSFETKARDPSDLACTVIPLCLLPKILVLGVIYLLVLSHFLFRLAIHFSGLIGTFLPYMNITGHMEWYQMRLGFPSWTNVTLMIMFLAVLTMCPRNAMKESARQIKLLGNMLIHMMWFSIYVILLLWSKSCA